MARQRPISVVELFEAGREYRLKYDGFGQHDLVAELLAGGQATVNAVDKEALGVVQAGHPEAAVPAAMVVRTGGLNAVMCRPFLNTSQTIGLEHFEQSGGYWRELPGLGLPKEAKLYQYDGRPNRTTALTSRFLLPRNPVFCLSLYRAEPAEDHDWTAAPPRTAIHFGGTEASEWALVFPYGGPMMLMRRQGGAWRKVPHTERTVRVPTLEGFAKGQRLFLWVAVLRGRIVVSTDGFAEDVWVYKDPEGPVEVPSAPVTLWHNAGQWMVSVFGVKMAEAVIDRAGIDTGYATLDCQGELILSCRQRAVLLDGGQVASAVTLSDVTESRGDLEATERAWRATLTPYVHQQTFEGEGGELEFETAVSPVLYSVQMGQYAEVEALGPLSSTEIQSEVVSLVGEHPEGDRAAQYEVRLDNQLGQRAELRDYRKARIALGWEHEEGVTETDTVFSGYVVEPAPSVEAGGRGAICARLLDPMIRLRDERCDGRAPVFDGWPVREVFEWVLDRCGIPRTRQDLEDTGTVLSEGPPERPSWRVEQGRPWWAFLQELAEYDYRAGIYFTQDMKFRKACRHCRRKRTSEDVVQHDGGLEGACPTDVDWELYTRSELAPAEKGAPILEVRRPRLTLGSDDFCNYVAVSGQSADGRPIRGAIYDAASLYDTESDRFVGWRKMRVWALNALLTQAEVNRLVSSALADLSVRPERLAVVVPLEPAMRIGQVVLLRGGEAAGTKDRLYRITAVRHEAVRRPRVVATTHAAARYLGEVS